MPDIEMLDHPGDDTKTEDDYNEEEDEDFNPEATAADKEETSSEDSDAEEIAGSKARAGITAKSRKNRQAAGATGTDAEDLDFGNSGDEGIIKEGSKEERKRKRGKKKDAQDEDSGGEGGFVKTRSMRAAEDPIHVKKSSVLAGKVTVDIDAVWARLNSAGVQPIASGLNEEDAESMDVEDTDTITIKRTYTFAGKIHTETKVVPKSSAQAKAYLATKDSRAGADEVEAVQVPAEVPKGKVGPDGQVLSKPRRRISAWDPNSTAFIKGLPAAPTISKTNSAGNALKVTNKSHLGTDAELWHRATPQLIMRAGRAVLQSAQGPAPLSATKQLRAQKLNVVDKSKLDWAEHVDTIEGAREELEKAKKDKSSYLERKDFLERVEDKAEDERAKARAVVR